MSKLQALVTAGLLALSQPSWGVETSSEDSIAAYKSISSDMQKKGTRVTKNEAVVNQIYEKLLEKYCIPTELIVGYNPIQAEYSGKNISILLRDEEGAKAYERTLHFGDDGKVSFNYTHYLGKTTAMGSFSTRISYCDSPRETIKTDRD